MNKKSLLIISLGLASLASARAETFEDVFSAVEHMGLGWNLGNHFDSNSGDTQNMWIEAWTDCTPDSYETAWGQAVTTREMIHLFKEAGFQAIRVPVTWYPHMGTIQLEDLASTNWVPIWNPDTWTGYDIDSTWMSRIKEVVDYVLDEGMYCILNVHHDTGAASTAWIVADENSYEANKERYEALWTQIAEEFKDYGERLLFEGYNEMLDPYGSWCFASLATSSGYNATVAASAYKAINSYAQSFVDAVRATGGNNSQRNLIIPTYCSAAGEGNWSTHLLDPLKELTLPADTEKDRLAVAIHSYPEVSKISDLAAVVKSMISNWKTYLMEAKNVPVVLGEWGTQTENMHPYKKEVAQEMVSQCAEAGVATFLWMSLMDCTTTFSADDLELIDVITKAYYGPEGYPGAGISGIQADAYDPNAPIYNLQGIQVKDASIPGIYIKSGKKFCIQ
ncbi:MAG: glycoside hydrolase family 5 protein [Bacteroidales bacterium]|nr:glycoside hydrolase family 5 protein [Bacteroidales bacterium]